MPRITRFFSTSSEVDGVARLEVGAASYFFYPRGPRKRHSRHRKFQICNPQLAPDPDFLISFEKWNHIKGVLLFLTYFRCP
jgi:hypothetical protein